MIPGPVKELWKKEFSASSWSVDFPVSPPKALFVSLDDPILTAKTVEENKVRPDVPWSKE